jgi:hypothetical protein
MTNKNAVPDAVARSEGTADQPSIRDARLGSRSGIRTREVQAWLDRLPQAARALALAETFPRIAERIASLDVDAAHAARYLTQLLIDQRGDRQGFPMEVGRELLRLRAYYAEMQGESGERGDVLGGHTLRPSARR